MEERVILHCDLNHFYALVELLSRPELRHVPLAVCGSAQAERLEGLMGIIEQKYGRGTLTRASFL